MGLDLRSRAQGSGHHMQKSVSSFVTFVLCFSPLVLFCFLISSPSPARPTACPPTTLFLLSLSLSLSLPFCASFFPSVFLYFPGFSASGWQEWCYEQPLESTAVAVSTVILNPKPNLSESHFLFPSPIYHCTSF